MRWAAPVEIDQQARTDEQRKTEQSEDQAFPFCSVGTQVNIVDLVLWQLGGAQGVLRRLHHFCESGGVIGLHIILAEGRLHFGLNFRSRLIGRICPHHRFVENKKSG